MPRGVQCPTAPKPESGAMWAPVSASYSASSRTIAIFLDCFALVKTSPLRTTATIFLGPGMSWARYVLGPVCPYS
jgi:hypothetical protein